MAVRALPKGRAAQTSQQAVAGDSVPEPSVLGLRAGVLCRRRLPVVLAGKRRELRLAPHWRLRLQYVERVSNGL